MNMLFVYYGFDTDRSIIYEYVHKRFVFQSRNKKITQRFEKIRLGSHDIYDIRFHCNCNCNIAICKEIQKTLDMFGARDK
jgi:hypothetical protein